MRTEGIAYKILLKTASENQLLALCEPGLRALLESQSSEREEFTEEKWKSVLLGAVDIGFACRDEIARKVLFDLIRSKTQKRFIDTLAASADLETRDEQSVLAYYRDNPTKIEQFLVWHRESGKGDDEEKARTGVVAPMRGLRYYQLQGMRNILETLEAKKRCLYQAPTGSGKTRTAMAVVVRHLMKYGPTKVLWLASTTELVDQACDAFRQEWKCKGDTDAVVYSWRGGNASFNPSHATVKNTMLVASVQLLTVRKEEVAALHGEVTLIVFDEAHQSLAKTYKAILDMLLENEGCKLLGLSATPVRTEGEKASKELGEMYGNNRIMIESGGHNPIDFLVGKGYLATAHFEKFNFHLRNFPKPKPNTEDYGLQLLDWLGANTERNNAVVGFVKRIIDQGRKRILVFTPTVLSARYCALMVRHLHGVDLSYSIYGDMDRSLRKRNLSKFSSSEKEPVVIFNCQVLTTGFDEPKTDAVMVARPTKSPTLYAQMIGRALRGPKSSGTKNAYIYIFADQELEGYNNLSRLFETFNQAWVEAVKGGFE